MLPSSSSALTKQPSSGDTSLMPPPPPPKRIKRPAQVLDEEDYEDALAHIIKRDFFPGLAETDTQTEYLAALDSGDPEWITEAGQRVREVMTPGPEGRRARGMSDEGVSALGRTPVVGIGTRGVGGQTPRGWVGDTPASVRSDVEKGALVEGRKAPADTSMGLGEFQARYTSEDNESFYKLIDRQNKKRGEKYAWLWAGNKLPSKQQTAQREQKLLGQGKTDQDGESNGKQLAVVEYVDKRKAAPDAWKAKPDNTFMFAPEGVEDETQTVFQLAEEKSKMGPKEIVYENTRMPPPPRPSAGSVPQSPSLSAVRDAIAGRPRLGSSSFAGAGGETPRVNGYAFVDSEEPAPEPESSAYDAPIDLGPGDATPNPFKIREAGSREALHHRMVEKLNKKEVDKRLESVKTPVPRFASSPKVQRTGGLTPAAQRLLGRVGGATPQRSTLGDTWGSTPTPRRKVELARATPGRKR